jgi:hypothetical protein
VQCKTFRLIFWVWSKTFVQTFCMQSMTVVWCEARL